MDTTRQHAIGLSGLPGSGKSKVAELLSDVYNCSIVAMGDVIREEAPDDATSDTLGAFAGEWRRDDPRGIGRKTVEMAQETGLNLVIIDGIRSPTDYEVLNEHFEEFHLIEVTAPFYERLDRLTERGRDGEDQFDRVDLAERDKREDRKLGHSEVVNRDLPDITINNSGGIPFLKTILSSIVWNGLPYEATTMNPVSSLDGREMSAEVTHSTADAQ